MSVQQQDVRARRKHNKVSTGCENCKKRRVKCDEVKPACQRCQKANLLCGGYHPPKARVFVPSKHSYIPSSECGTSHLDLQEWDVLTALQRHHEIQSPTLLTKATDLRLLWQKALLDTFLTMWLSDGLVRDCTAGKGPGSMVPFSSWPSVAWKLAKRKDESFVAHSLLCLTLCVLGSRTGDLSLVGEASRHYARVLHQFQSQVALLAQSGYSPKHDEHVASLAAAGFCCSQIEYILQSWTNGDRHLQGMASLLQACGPLCLKHEDSRKIFYDHCLLWLSCSVVHRRSTIYAQKPGMEVDWAQITSSSATSRAVVAVAERIPSLLEEYDTSHQCYSSAQMLDLLQRLAGVIADLEALDLSCSLDVRCEPASGTLACVDIEDEHPPSESTADFQPKHQSLPTTIVTGYTSAFLIHAAATAWKIVRSQSTDLNSENSIVDPTANQLREMCEHHVLKIRHSIDELASERYGMMTTSPLLFLVDSAWMAYATLSEHCGRDLSDIKPWFTKVGSHLASAGYRPLREPWLVS